MSGFIGYFTSRGINLRLVITPARVDICPLIVSVEEKHSQHKNFNFSFLLFNMEGNQTSVIESSEGDITKFMASTVPESTKKPLRYAVNVFKGGESHEYTFKAGVHMNRSEI